MFQTPPRVSVCWRAEQFGPIPLSPHDGLGVESKPHMLFGLLFSLTLLAQEESVTVLKNPFDTAPDRASGARIFLSQCAACHGRDGRGGQGTPDFTTGVFKRASSDEGLFGLVNKGVPGTTMPGFALKAHEAWQVLAYIRSLSAGRAMAANIPGDAAHGRALYRDLGCARCHDHTAPDLTGIGRFQTSSEIRKSIVEPQINVDPAYWRLKATTTEGRALTGLRMNEDTYTVQFLDDQSKLRSVLKSDLAKYEIIRTSPMPLLNLTDAQIDDLIAYMSK